MSIYRIYMRSFAPWRRFGSLIKAGSISIPVVEYHAPAMFDPGVSVRLAPLPYGGDFHGDGRGFSLDTTSPAVTARVNALLEVQVPVGLAGQKRAWCNESRGPSMGLGFESSAVGVPDAEFTVSKEGGSVKAIIDYGAPNPLVKGAPDINARGEFVLQAVPGTLTITTTITGDQFPACESFIEDSRGSKLFLGGFAPNNKEQILRLFGSMNKPPEVWFESEIVVTIDPVGAFKTVKGGGSGSNSSGPYCEGLTLSVTEWNARIMGSIAMPPDAP
jgi:hypothetical protein